VAQRKRVWLITRRPKDQNLPKQMQVLAQLVERSTVVVNKHRTAAGSIPASLKQISLEEIWHHLSERWFWSDSVDGYHTGF